MAYSIRWISLTRLPVRDEASASFADRNGLREDGLISHHTRLLSMDQQYGAYYTRFRCPVKSAGLSAAILNLACRR